MITFLTGENTFEIAQELERIIAKFDGAPERIDGSELDPRQLPNLLTGTTLFADKRLVIIKDLSQNKSIWTDFADWLPRVPDEIHLVLVDSKPDKRTITYKELKKVANITEHVAWTDRDESKAAKWVSGEAQSMGLKLNTKSVQTLVRRVGTDQWSLFHALEKLALAGDVTDEIIESIIDVNPTENVFNLFDAALRGDANAVSQIIKTLELTEDPYRLFALLSGQAFQLTTLAVAGQSDMVAKDLGVSPYTVSKLVPAAKRLGRGGVRRVIRIFANADDDMKLSRAEPWLLIERALIQVALQ
ncbi:DNA polymerase III subunit delta [Patescibacteria group bacterium]|nr:MAG: DNA polymerase III subunit delta [Patescibacteria group bacterium]